MFLSAADLPTAAELLRPICPEDEPTHAGSPSATGTEDVLQTETLVQLSVHKRTHTTQNLS